MGKRLVILSGRGELPHIFKKLSRDKGYETYTVGVRGITDKKTDFVVPFLGFKQFEELLLKLERPQIVMLGKFDQKLSVVLYNSLLQKLKSLFFTEQFEENYGIYKLIKEGAKNKQPKELIASFIQYMESRDFTFLPSEEIKEIAKTLLVEEGFLTGQVYDIEIEQFREIFKIAKQIADWDIGQTITVKDGTIVAVEGVEGTDETIKRTCKLVGKGFSVIKVARTEQDFRIDVPTVGMETLKLLKKCRVKNLILEAGKVFIVPKAEFLKEAKKAEINVIGLAPR